MVKSNLLLAMVVAAVTALNAQAPTPAPKPVQAPTPTPAPKPVQARARPTTAAIDLRVTDGVGAILSGVRVTAQGPVSREGATSEEGALRLTALEPGTYRLRFVREGSITLERDVTVRAGDALGVQIMLSVAPPPPKPPEPPPPPPPPPPVVEKTLPPPGPPRVVGLLDFVERNFIGGREARKDSALGCTASGKGTLHQLRQPWASHTHDLSDEWLYVVAGEGILRIGTEDHRLEAGTMSLIPHTVTHMIQPQGRNPLMLVSIMSGEACDSN